MQPSTGRYTFVAIIAVAHLGNWQPQLEVLRDLPARGRPQPRSNVKYWVSHTNHISDQAKNSFLQSIFCNHRTVQSFCIHKQLFFRKSNLQFFSLVYLSIQLSFKCVIYLFNRSDLWGETKQFCLLGSGDFV